MDRRQALVTGLGVAASMGLPSLAFSSSLSDFMAAREGLTRLSTEELVELELATRDVSTVRFDGARITLPMPATVARRYNATVYIKYEVEPFLRVFDSTGVELESISLPDSLQVKDFAIDRYGNMFVVSRGTHEITWLDSQGSELATIGHFGWQLEEELNGPASITIDMFDQIHVLNAGTRSVKVFTSSGAFVREYGHSQWLPEQALGAVDGETRIHVLEHLSGNKIWTFSTNGVFIAETQAKDPSTNQ